MDKVPVMMNEAAFQRWVIARFVACGAHVQRHDFSQWPDIPDLSVGYGGEHYWLELKYARFELPNDKPYPRFELKTLTRGQLRWLNERNLAGGGCCGILSYFTTGSTTHYVSYTPVAYYKPWLLDRGISVGGAVLSDWTGRADDVLVAGYDLFKFMREASRAWSRKR